MHIYLFSKDAVKKKERSAIVKKTSEAADYENLRKKGLHCIKNPGPKHSLGLALSVNSLWEI
jgi:hypothetical protein